MGRGCRKTWRRLGIGGGRVILWCGFGVMYDLRCGDLCGARILIWWGAAGSPYRLCEECVK